MKIALNKGDFGMLSLSQLFEIHAAAPGGAPPRRVNNREQSKKTRNCPAVPARGPEAGSSHICHFHGPGVNSRSCAFLQSNIFHATLYVVSLTHRSTGSFP